MHLSSGTIRALLSVWTLAAMCGAARARAATPPATSARSPFGPNVIVLDPTTAGAQKRVDEIFARQEKSQFGDGRYAARPPP